MLLAKLTAATLGWSAMVQGGEGVHTGGKQRLNGAACCLGSAVQIPQLGTWELLGVQGASGLGAQYSAIDVLSL